MLEADQSRSAAGLTGTGEAQSLEKYLESYKNNYRVPADWPRDGSVLEERVIQVGYDPMRKAMIALTGYGDKLRWQIGGL